MGQSSAGSGAQLLLLRLHQHADTWWLAGRSDRWQARLRLRSRRHLRVHPSDPARGQI